MSIMPSEMLVEVTNRCNHKCVFCAHRKMNIKLGEIDPDLLKRILQEAYVMGVRRIGLYTTGEMFLCKEIETHIRNAKEIGFTYIYSDTNGALATKENMKKVLLAGLDSIKFSINAGTKETYQNIHGRDDFDIVLQNLKDCYSLKKELGLKFKLMVSYVVTSKNEDEMDDFRKRIIPYIDQFCPQSVRTVLLQDPADLSYLSPQTAKKYDPPQIPCSMIFRRIHVTYNGFLSACCIDFNHDLLLADLKTMSLLDAWNCSKAVQFRNKHLSKDLAGTLCYNCFLDKYNPYEPLVPSGISEGI